jgi:4-hydroxy-3-polyprenylbenzoate decarboxylase
MKPQLASNVEFSDRIERYADLREFVDQVEQIGELKKISGAHWNLEMCAISELYGKTIQGGSIYPPALLFDDVPGYPKGFRVLWGTTNSPGRMSLVYGFKNATTPLACAQAYRDRMKSSFKLIPPRRVARGPVLENVDRDDDVDLFKFPVPKVHDADGGRYIGSHDIVIMRDPDSDWINAGTYRAMVHDKNTLGLWISPGKNGRMIREKYLSRGKPCPVIISVGNDPLVWFSAGSEMNHGINELAYAGGYQGYPIDVVESELFGLPMPATDEVVLEGEILPDQSITEGPFGEFTGYYASGEQQSPAVRIRRVYYRNNPILTVARPGHPPHDYTFGKSVTKSATIWDQVELAGVPGVKGVWSHGAGGARMYNVIAIEQLFPGHARMAANIANNCMAGNYLGRWTVVVDDDIDPSNLYDVTWAISTRCDPATDIEVLNNQWSGPLDPLLRPGTHFNSRGLIDACRPWSRRDSFPPVAEISPEHLAEARKKWGPILGLD